MLNPSKSRSNFGSEDDRLLRPQITDDQLVRAYRWFGGILAFAIALFGVVRNVRPGEFQDPLGARFAVLAALVGAVALSYASRRVAQRLPTIIYGLTYVVTLWTIWLGQLNGFVPSYTTTVDLLILVQGLILGVNGVSPPRIVAFLVVNASAAVGALLLADAPESDPRTFLVGLVGSCVAVIVTTFVHRRARAAQFESEAQWRRLVEDHPDAIVVVMDGVIAYANRVARDDLQGDDDGILVGAPVSVVSKRLAAEIDTQATPRPFQVDEIARADHRRSTYEVRDMPIRFEGRDALQVVLRDETERVETARFLEEARQNAEAASRAKADFLAVMSHEIRTPLNGVIGLTDLLFDESLDERAREYAELIRLSSDSLLVVLNDILDFSKIEAGQMDLEAVPFRVAELVTATHHIMRPKAVEKGLRFEARAASDMPLFVVGDPLRLRQISLNLVSNALKFTESGAVSMLVSAEEGAEPGRVILQLEVRDTGMGIPSNKLSKLFQPFTQVEPSTTRKHGGTGLGLNICQRLVELMGGTIEVSSEVGRGSTFTVRVPVEVADAPQASLPGVAGSLPAVPAEDAPRLSVLVAEDNAVNQKVVVKLLERLGHAADVVEDGLAAVRAVRERRYDVVLMDMMMPHMDGLDATRAIVGLAPPKERPLIVGLTANALESDRRRCLDAGMDDFLTKPVRRKDLEAALRRVKPASEPAARPRVARPDSTSPPPP